MANRGDKFIINRTKNISKKTNSKYVFNEAKSVLNKVLNGGVQKGRLEKYKNNYLGVKGVVNKLFNKTDSLSENDKLEYRKLINEISRCVYIKILVYNLEKENKIENMHLVRRPSHIGVNIKKGKEVEFVNHNLSL